MRPTAHVQLGGDPFHRRRRFGCQPSASAIVISCASGQVSVDWTRKVVWNVADGVVISQIHESWNAMLVVCNEAGVGDSQVLVDWNQVSIDWNEPGVGAARDASDEAEVFVGWNEDIIVRQCWRTANV